MIIINDNGLSGFKFWSGAVSRADMFSEREMDIIERELEDMYPEGMTETQINDMFWFEEDFLAQLVGYEDFETMCEIKEEEGLE